MSKIEFSRRTSSLLFLSSVVFAGLLGIVFLEVNDLHAVENTKTMNTERILPSQVTLSNLEAFEDQVRHDLPVGTPKQEEKTITQEGIPHFFRRRSWPYWKYVYGTLKNLGVWKGVFMASLAIRIHIDPKERVDAIKFRLDLSMKSSCVGWVWD